MTEPPPPRTLPRTLGALLSGGLGVLYLLNPTAGVFELIPDAIPFVGNLDEATATLLVVGCVRYLRATRRHKTTIAPPGQSNP